MKKGKVKFFRDYNFNGIDCMISYDGKELGFFKDDNDMRPSSATYIDKDAAEHLFKLFGIVAKVEIINDMKAFEKNRRKLIITKAHGIEFSGKDYYVYMRGCTDGHCTFRQNFIKFIENQEENVRREINGRNISICK